MPTPNYQNIRIEFDQRVPLRDGITLSADIYHPSSISEREFIDNTV